MSKIREIISDGDFAEWVRAFIPIAFIVALAVVFVTVSLARGGIGQ